MEPSRSPRAAASEERDATSQGRHGPDHLPPPSPRRRFPSLVLAFASSPHSQLCPTSNQPRSLRLVTFPENCFSLWFQTRREGGGLSDRFDRSIGDATRQERHGANMTERLQRLLGSQLGMNLGGAPTDAPQVDTAEQVYISSLALLKMLKHGRAGVPMEVSENVAPTTNNKASSRSFLLPVTATRIITSTSAREFGRSVEKEEVC